MIAKIFASFLLSIFLSAFCNAQAKPDSPTPKPDAANCTHTPGAHMCNEDYDLWVKQHSPFKPWYKDPGFLVGEAVIAAAVSADMKTSSIGRDNHYVEAGGILLPAVPSNRDYVLVGLAAFGTYSALNYINFHFVGQKNPSKAWKVFSYVAMPTVAAAIHGHAAYHNMECCSSPWQSPLGGTPHY